MKHVIDRAVAAELGVSSTTVSRITAEFIRQFGLHLAEYGRISLEGLGRFWVKKILSPRVNVLMTGTFRKGESTATRRVVVPWYLRVHFSKGPTLKKLLDKQFKESLMEKYAVEENINQEQLEKKASEGCPECGRKPTVHGRVLICPEHGSAPFEPEPTDT